MQEPSALAWRASPATTAAHLTRERPRPFLIPRHVAHLDAVVQRAVLEGERTGRGGRVMVFMPPGHGKSTYCSTWLLAWYLSMWPERQTISTANTALLAERNGRSVRDVFDEFGEELGTRLRPDTTAAARWMTDADGGLFGCGVGASLPGWRAHLIGVDDPHGGLKEVRSPVERESIWEWYVGTLRNRLEPGGTIVLLMTRWHEDDLAGRLLRQAAEGGEQWSVVRLPAVAECPDDGNPATWRDELGRADGEALWPERWPREALEAATAGSAYVRSALFQQDPHDDESAMFPRKVLEAAVVDDWPKHQARAVRYWDKAATKREGVNQFPQTAGCLAALHEGVLYLVDMRTAQEDPPGVEALVRATAERDGPAVRVYVEQEPGSAGKDVIFHYQRRVLPGRFVEGHLPGANKEVRADPLSSMFRVGSAKLVKGPWNRAFIDEAGKFPRGRRKDQVDAASGACAVLAANPPSLLAAMAACGGQSRRASSAGYVRDWRDERDARERLERGLRHTAKGQYDAAFGPFDRTPW